MKKSIWKILYIDSGRLTKNRAVNDNVVLDKNPDEPGGDVSIGDQSWNDPLAI